MAPFCWKCGAPPTTLEPLPVPSSLTRLLESNDPPLEYEIPFIRDISQGQNRMDALDAQIRLLQATLAELGRKRDETAGYVQQYSAILSPVRRVPPELICETFALTLSRDDHDDILGDMSILGTCSALIYPFVILHHRPLVPVF